MSRASIQDVSIVGLSGWILWHGCVSWESPVLGETGLWSLGLNFNILSLSPLPLLCGLCQCLDRWLDQTRTACCRTDADSNGCFRVPTVSCAWKHTSDWLTTPASSISSMITCGSSSWAPPTSLNTLACSRGCSQSRLCGHSAFQWSKAPHTLQWVLLMLASNLSLPPLGPPLRKPRAP